KLGPGEPVKLAVAVSDAQGKPVADAEAAVIVVDEAILSLTSAQFVDPIATFYARRGADTRDYYERSYVKLARPKLDELTRDQTRNRGDAAFDANAGPVGGAMPPPPPAPPGAMAKPEARMATLEAASTMGVAAPEPQASQMIAIRSDFNPLAAFAPAVRTDAAGKATVELKLPDNLTRYRVVAIAVAGERQFGKG